MKWLPGIAAIFAAVMIADHTGMTWWQGVMLWVAFDLMTARGQVRAMWR